MATINALNNASAPFGVTGNLTVTTGNISTTSGNISTASGSVSASTTVTAGTNLVSTAGNLLLPTTSSTVGQIQINSVKWAHSYGTANTFVGANAGNTTLNTANTNYNTALGFEALKSIAGASVNSNSNTAVGWKALTAYIENLGGNSAFGAGSALAITSGSNNVFFGKDTGGQLVSGSNNCLIGTLSGPPYAAGYNYTGSESNNICLLAEGTAGESNKMRLGRTGTGAGQVNAAYIAGTYATGATPSGTAKVALIDSVELHYGLAGAANTLFVGGTAPSFTATPQCTDLTLTGVLKLPTTSSTVGQIQINSVASFHAYGTSSIFVGPNSGNFTFTTANAQYSTAIGVDSLNSITGTNTNLGTQNTAAGYNSLGDCTDGSYNVGVGVNSGSSITTGSNNTCVGHNAGYSSATTGSNNTMLGAATGQTLATTDASNILIGSAADLAAGTSNALKIGSGAGTGAGQLNKAWIHGIRGITTVNNDAIAVLVDSAGQLGTVSSSLKLKENIKDMADRTSSIMSLRPVTFSYKTHVNKSVPSYGLIAEEVAEVFPDLVVYDKENHPDTIKYHELPVMILNELQKLAKRVEELEKKLKDKGE